MSTNARCDKPIAIQHKLLTQTL